MPRIAGFEIRVREGPSCRMGCKSLEVVGLLLKIANKNSMAVRAGPSHCKLLNEECPTLDRLEKWRQYEPYTSGQLSCGALLSGGVPVSSHQDTTFFIIIDLISDKSTR